MVRLLGPHCLKKYIAIDYHAESIPPRKVSRDQVRDLLIVANCRPRLRRHSVRRVRVHQLPDAHDIVSLQWRGKYFACFDCWRTATTNRDVGGVTPTRLVSLGLQIVHDMIPGIIVLNRRNEAHNVALCAVTNNIKHAK